MAKSPKSRSPYVTLAVDFGYMLLAAVLLIGGAGYWLDQYLGSFPWITFAGSMIGVATAFQSLIRRLNQSEAAAKARRQGNDQERGEGRREPQ